MDFMRPGPGIFLIQLEIHEKVDRALTIVARQARQTGITIFPPN